MNLDLTFHTKEGRFNYRVGAIIISKGKILVVKNKNSTYFYSVGGRVKYNETSSEAVKREVKEELGLDIEIDRPVFFHEKFFNEKDSKEHFHEISIYYLMKTPENIEEMKCNSITENNLKEELFWLPIKNLGDHNVFPEFFSEELLNIPNSIKTIEDTIER